MSDFIRKMPWDELAKENANLLAENEWLRERNRWLQLFLKTVNEKSSELLPRTENERLRNRGRKINRPKEDNMPSITIGRIVHYVVNQSTADAINRRRDDAYEHIDEHRARADGSIIHVGNKVHKGDEFPLMVTRVFNSVYADLDTCINGQLLLDGNDTYWLTSVYEGEGPGYWHWPEEADDE